MTKDIHLSKTTKNKKIIIVLLIAVIFAALAVFGSYKVLTAKRTTVYVFNNDYSAGTQVTSGMLTPVGVDNNLVVGGNSVSTGDYVITQENYSQVLSTAGILRNDVRAGNFFTSSMLSTTGGNRIEMVMQKNAVAVTIGANNVTGVTTGLAYGSRVNVYANYNEQTTLLLQNVKVLSVSFENGAMTTITLEVNTSDSMRVVHAYTYGTIHLGLVDMTGYQETYKNGLTYDMSGFTEAK